MHLKHYQPYRLAQEISATSIIAQFFAFYLFIIYYVFGISPAEWSWRDPVLNLTPHNFTVWFILLSSLVTMCFWLYVAKPTAEIMHYCLREAVIAAIVAICCVSLMRLVVGPFIPSFIPSEESARSGLVLNMTAGFGEEVYFRLIMLPAIFYSLIRLVGYQTSIIISVVLLGLLFEALHQLGTIEPGINWHYFILRTVVPGIIFSLIFFYRSPTFAVIFHSTTHVLIPLIFSTQ